MSELFETLTRKLELKLQRRLLIRNVSERLLILGIEIGRGKPLSAGEKRRYAQTLPTARFIATAEETLDANDPMRAEVEQVVNGTLANWLRREPELKATLEAWSNEPIMDDFDTPSPEALEKFKEQIREIMARTGQKLVAGEFEQLVQKVLSPFDGIESLEIEKKDSSKGLSKNAGD